LPLFTDECTRTLEREGIDVQEAIEDFQAGRDHWDEVDREWYRYGQLGVYLYEPRFVFGRRDELVTYVWLR